ncbi:MAG: hypothetical protein ACRENZ_01220 [Thermodesulfobacteriota bacterium]
MRKAARKLNFMISEDVALELEKLVPRRQRSKLVNEALQKELSLIRRSQITKKLYKLRESSPLLTTKEIVSLLQHDRKRG